MNDFPVQKLTELINVHGITLTEDADHCEFLLRANCGNNYQLEVFLLINAIKEGITQELLKIPPPNISKEAWYGYLSQRLYNNYLAFLGLEKPAAEWAVQSWGMILAQWLVKIKNPPKLLFPWNPFDHLRLLWWVLVMPQQIQNYRRFYGETDENRIGKWLVSTLTWWPLLLPTLAAGLELFLPPNDNWPPNAYLWFTALLVGCWLLTGRLGNVGQGNVMGNVAFGVVFSVVFGVTYVLAIVTALFVASGMMHHTTTGIAFIVAYVVSFYIAYVIAVGVAFSVRNTITDSLKTGTPYSLARFAFFFLITAYLFLIWFCFLGGEQLLL
jgi:hypothetical protein